MHRTDNALHGNAPDKADVALIIIDMINDLEFDDGAQLFEQAWPMTNNLVRLKQRFVASGLPIVYANDNFGRWKSDFRAQVDHCLQDGVRGKPIAERIKPEDRDYFVLKAKHSAFFHTTLDLLLDYLQVQTLVLTGVATDICVLFTANDAYMRDFQIVVPSDCVAANTEARTRNSLALMRRVLKAQTPLADDLELLAKHRPSST